MRAVARTEEEAKELGPVLDFMRILWEDPLGVQLILIALTLEIAGTFIISRLVRIEY